MVKKGVKFFTKFVIFLLILSPIKANKQGG